MIPVNKRKIGVCILLSILTFGLYQIYWGYLLVKNTRAIQKDESSCTGEMLCLLFVPFYSVYWGYAKGKQMYEDSGKRGGNITDRKYIYLFMNLICMQLFTLGFIQTQLNAYQSR